MFLRDTSDILSRTAILDEYGNCLTYGELEVLGREYLATIPTRSLVMILCDYQIDTVAFYYCQMINHAVPVLVDKNLNRDLLLKMIRVYELQFIWCPNRTEEMLAEDTLQVLFRKGEHSLIQTRFGSCEMYSDLALLLTTSGSTGSVKLVRLSYENLRSNIRDFADAVGAREDDRGITTAPMCHCYGLSLLHMQWVVGACACITENALLDVAFWDFFDKSHITYFAAGVPYAFEILQKIGFLEKEYGSLRFITQGGGKLPEEQQTLFGERLREKGVRLYVCYGQTEATACISVLSSEKATKKLGSVGAPISGMSISCLDANDRGEGELVCKGQSISLGYAVDRSDLTRGDDNLGCLYTGDIVLVDEEGDIFIRGRKSRIVKILGARVGLDELESALSERFAGVKFACVGVDNRIDICCLTKGLEKEILEFCKCEMSIPGKMVVCHYVEEFPYTVSGKLEYRKLQEHILSGEGNDQCHYTCV